MSILNIVTEGDSTTRAYGPTVGQEWPALFAELLRGDGHTVTLHNVAADGSSMTQVNSRAATDDALFDATSGVLNYFILLDGINDRIGSVSASDLLTAQTAWYNARVTAGWVPVMCTPFGNWYGSYSIGITTFVNGLKSLTSHIIDFNGEPMMGSPSTFQVYPLTLDQIHCPDFGNQCLAAKAYADFRTNVLSSSAKPVITSVWMPIGQSGASVDLYGVGLTGLTNVSFNSVAATSFSVVSNTHVTAIVPVTTTGPISVIGPSGNFTTPFNFTYANPNIWAPSITSAIPTHATPLARVDFAGDRLVSCTGTAQGIAMPSYYPAILYGGVSAFLALPNNVSSGSGPFVFTNIYGSSSPFAFTIDAPPTPTITGGPTNSTWGGYGTWTGQGFSGGGVTCTYNGLNCLYYSPETDNSVVIGLPNGSGSIRANLVITTPQGTASWSVSIGDVFDTTSSVFTITHPQITSSSEFAPHVFHKAINNAWSTLSVAHVQYDRSLTVNNITPFGNPTSSAPICVSIGNSIFSITNKSGNTLHISSILEGSIDADYPIGTRVDARLTAGHITDLQNAILDITNLPTQSGNAGKYLRTDGSIMAWATVDSGGIIIGNAVSGGTAKSILFVDNSGNLSQNSTNITWDNATITFFVTGVINTNKITTKSLVGQTGNIYQNTNSSDIPISWFDSAGNLNINPSTVAGESVFIGQIPSFYSSGYSGIWFGCSSITANSTNYTFLGNHSDGYSIINSATTLQFRCSNVTLIDCTGAKTTIGYSVDSSSAFVNTTLTVITANSSYAGITIKGQSGQEGNYLQIYNSSNVLISNIDHNGAIASGRSTTGSRPTVSTIGAQWFDTTLGIPIWWNGSAWVNASGTAV